MDVQSSGDLLHGDWYTTEEVAALIGVDPSTLRRWRTSRVPQGPAFVKMSSRVTQYSGNDVRRWLLAHRIDPEQAA
jgi:hypothetical protein